MDEITRLAKLLEIPGIEPETAALINAKLRELIGKADQQAEAPVSMDQLPSLMLEYLEGVKNDGSNGNGAR